METTEITTGALDERWYDRLKETASVSSLDVLLGDKKILWDQKGKVLSGEIENPTFDYSEIDTGDLMKREKSLQDLKRDILKDEESEAIKKAYLWRINEAIARLRLLKYVAEGNMQKFKICAEAIYGKPSKAIFRHELQAIRSQVDGNLNSQNPDLQNVAEELNDLLPKDSNEPIDAPPSLPVTDIIKQTRTCIRDTIGHIVKIPQDTTTFDAEGIKTVFNYALQQLNAEGWLAVVDTGGQTWMTTSASTKEIKIPADMTLSAQRLEELLMHEIGTHVARRQNGERGKFKLLGLGLHGSEKAEEGIATAREQAIKGKMKDFAHLERHFAVCLALGLDGKPRNFREVFEIIKRYYLMQRLAGGKNTTDSERLANTATWSLCVRIFRGTDCKTRGVCFPKDMIYREGNIGIWGIVGKDPGSMMKFNIGRYDPTNRQHLWILSRLGITEEDLAVI